MRYRDDLRGTPDEYRQCTKPAGFPGPGCQRLSALSKLAMAQPRNYHDKLGADKALYKDLAVCLLNEGVLVLPDGPWYFTTADCDEDIEATLEAMENNTA
jgi:glutamate-1-semialdehyde aminotransferase